MPRICKCNETDRWFCEHDVELAKRKVRKEFYDKVDNRIEDLHDLHQWHIAFDEDEKVFSNLEVRNILRKIKKEQKDNDS